MLNRREEMHTPLDALYCCKPVNHHIVWNRCASLVATRPEKHHRFSLGGLALTRGEGVAERLGGVTAAVWSGLLPTVTVPEVPL